MFSWAASQGVIMSDPCWQRTPDCVSATVDGDLVVLLLETGEYTTLNATATSIWDLIAEPRRAEDIASVLSSKYKTTADACAPAVRACLDTLEAKGLVSRVG